MNRRRLLASSLAAATAATLAATALPALGDPAAATSPVGSVAVGALVDAVPAWARRTPDAAEPASADVSFVVQLANRHAGELTRVTNEVSDPASPRYQHFVSKQRFATRYAPTAASTSAVTGWLRTSGLTVDSVTPLRTFVAVHGPASVVSSALATSFGLFDVDGLRLRSPLTAPVVPAALTGIVTNLAGLAESAPLHNFAAPSPVFLNARPCSTFYGQKLAKAQPKYHGTVVPDAVCGYTGKQLRTAYGVDQQKYTGKGASVGIVDAYASPTIAADANTYATKHGDQPFRAGQLVQNVPPGEMQIPEDPASLLLDPQGWAGEQTLDVEAVHAMAPDAKIVYQSAVSPYGPMLYLALMQVVEGGQVQIVSNSYGTGSDSPLATDKLMFDQITKTAGAMGVTIDFSSGDSGDETDPSANGARTGDFPATSNFVTAVGGTTLDVDKQGRRVGETYWGTRKDPLVGGEYDFKHVVFSGAGGGGVSTSYDEPKWQKPVVPKSLTTIGRATPGRVEPDVSMVADSTTGFLTGQTQTFADGSVKYSEYRIGGTSLSCPLFSGVLALAVGARKGKGLGLVTPTLYANSKKVVSRNKLWNDPTSVAVNPRTHQSLLGNVRPDFVDPTDPTSKVTYSLRTLGNLATLHRFKGYDDSTGLGTPKVPGLLKRLIVSARR